VVGSGTGDGVPDTSFPSVVPKEKSTLDTVEPVVTPGTERSKTIGPKRNGL
jgi:hypothetical protein